MQIPRAVAVFNKLINNRVQRLWAWVLPPWAILRHTGRRSGTVFRTPVVGFVCADGFVVPLLYGERSDWARNILAADGGIIERRGRTYELQDPRVVDSALIAITGIGARYVRAAPKALVATIGPRV
ncbi:PNPOx family protein [Nocardioides terrisoli]|uniref:nitroreductase family deazaflavin-dependent oxidoreductase n=1 Tax=Nocardioides terrisoli TaxID=3388267 RepID=UPI00287BC9DA|nr:nitroreductase family deazaflavin-dependent oxidoreductase [Nocardioides marmorisolisilvae]